MKSTLTHLSAAPRNLLRNLKKQPKRREVLNLDSNLTLLLVIILVSVPIFDKQKTLEDKLGL